MAKCSKGCSSRPRIGALNHPVDVLDRRQLPPAPGSAEPRWQYKPLLTGQWAQVETLTGVSEFAAVEVGGKRATHAFTIRSPQVEIDTRHRVALNGQYYQVLGVKSINEAGQFSVIYARNLGEESAPPVTGELK